MKNPEVDREITGAIENTCALFMGESLRSSTGTCLYFLPRFFNPQKLGDADWRGEAVFNYEEKKMEFRIYPLSLYGLFALSLLRAKFWYALGTYWL